MASNLILGVVCIFSIWVIADGAGNHHGAPAPAVDCSSLVLNMADCLSFVSNGSTSTKPEGNCCSGLKTVLKTDAECLCEAFKSSTQLGVALNVTKALTLPSACKLHAPSVSNCGLGALTPAGAPGVSPSPGTSAAAPTVPAGASVQSPAGAPTPGAGGSHAISISIGSLAIGLLIALFSSF